MRQRIKKGFDGVVADEQLKQQTENLLIQQIRQKKQSPLSRWRRARVQVIMALAILLTLAGFYVYQTPVAAVSVDSQASLELRVNRFNRVVEVVGFDASGKRLAAELRVKHRDVDAAMADVLRAADSGTENVYVTVASKQGSRLGRIMAKLAEHQGTMAHLMLFETAAETMADAEAQGVTVGRMRAMHELRQFEAETAGEEFMVDSTEELIEAVESHRMMMKHKK